MRAVQMLLCWLTRRVKGRANPTPRLRLIALPSVQMPCAGTFGEFVAYSQHPGSAWTRTPTGRPSSQREGALNQSLFLLRDEVSRCRGQAPRRDMSLPSFPLNLTIPTTRLLKRWPSFPKPPRPLPRRSLFTKISMTDPHWRRRISSTACCRGGKGSLAPPVHSGPPRGRRRIRSPDVPRPASRGLQTF